MVSFGSDQQFQNMLPSLADIVKNAGLDPAHLSISIPCKEDGVIQDFKRNKIYVYDGSKEVLWEVSELTKLFRGDKKAPSISTMDYYPEEYVPFFTCVEMHIMTICNMLGDPTDEEWILIYNAMRKYPDGKDLGPVHRIVWQSAALALGLNLYSQEEYEAIFAQLARSARHWRIGASSRNYTAYLRQHLGR